MKTHTTNYNNTFIVVAEDCPAVHAEIPPLKSDKLSIANIQYELIVKHPYVYTSDEVLFMTHVQRNELTPDEHSAAQTTLFSKGQACLRTSPLAKRYGWGIHHNELGQVALYAMNSDKYNSFVNDKKVVKVKAMRSKRK